MSGRVDETRGDTPYIALTLIALIDFALHPATQATSHSSEHRIAPRSIEPHSHSSNAMLAGVRCGLCCRVEGKVDQGYQG
jgi:hypothetical protein